MEFHLPPPSTPRPCFPINSRSLPSILSRSFGTTTRPCICRLRIATARWLWRSPTRPPRSLTRLRMTPFPQARERKDTVAGCVTNGSIVRVHSRSICWSTRVKKPGHVRSAAGASAYLQTSIVTPVAAGKSGSKPTVWRQILHLHLLYPILPNIPSPPPLPLLLPPPLPLRVTVLMPIANLRLS
jgi:hypothetical protein